MHGRGKVTWRRLACVLAAAAALANGGCLLVAAGAAAGGAATYAYAKGKVCRSYPANHGDTRAAVHAALAELKLPVVEEDVNASASSVESRTARGDKLRVFLDTQVSPIPAEGSVTRVCVRVATFGDQDVSERILDQIGFHLVPAGLAGPPAPPVPPSPPSGAVQPAGGFQPAKAPPETPPPPLARP